MSPRCTRTLVGGATALGIGLFAALPSALSASAAATAKIPTIKAHHVLYDVGIHSDVTPAEAARTNALGFTSYTASVKVGTKSYTYTIAGKNPAIKSSNPAATISAVLIPVKIVFPGTGLSWDPTKTDSCDSGASALSRTQGSPIVKSTTFKFGGTNVGNVQVTNAFQRAEFWKYAAPTGINPKFGVTLNWKTIKPVTISVPLSQAADAAIPCGNGELGAVNINWLDPHLQKTVIPSLKSQGVSPSALPFFLLHNVVEYVGTTSQCCVIGYHNAYNVSGGVQTYGLGDYDNSTAFGTGVQDISALTHEVGEWQNDPNTVNPTPAWGHIGQVTGCQNNLEVGDPLSGTNFTVKLSGFTYHSQELAFFSWFYRQKPSLGVNGWYSDQGTFRSPAKACA